MDASIHDLLLVDGGAVGLCAAIAAEELNPSSASLSYLRRTIRA